MHKVVIERSHWIHSQVPSQAMSDDGKNFCAVGFLLKSLGCPLENLKSLGQQTATLINTDFLQTEVEGLPLHKRLDLMDSVVRLKYLGSINHLFQHRDTQATVEDLNDRSTFSDEELETVLTEVFAAGGFELEFV